MMNADNGSTETAAFHQKQWIVSSPTNIQKQIEDFFDSSKADFFPVVSMSSDLTLDNNIFTLLEEYEPLIAPIDRVKWLLVASYTAFCRADYHSADTYLNNAESIHLGGAVFQHILQLQKIQIKYAQNKVQEAKAMLVSLLEIREQGPTVDRLLNLLLMMSLRLRAGISIREDDLTQAESALRDAENWLFAVNTEIPDQYSRQWTLNALVRSDLLFGQGQFEEAHDWAQKAFEKSSLLVSPDDLSVTDLNDDLATACFYIGRSAMQIGKDNEAQQTLHLAWQYFSARYSAIDHRALTVRLALAKLAFNYQRFGLARRLFIEIKPNLPHLDLFGVVDFYYYYGWLLSKQAFFTQNEASWKTDDNAQALLISGIRELLTNHPGYQFRVHQQSLPLTSAQKILSMLGIKNYKNRFFHPALAKLLHGLATNFYYLSQYQAAEALYQETLAINVGRFEPPLQGQALLKQAENLFAGKKLTKPAMTFQCLANLAFRCGRYLEAERLYKSLLTIQHKACQDAVGQLITKYYLSWLYFELDRCDQVDFPEINPEKLESYPALITCLEIKLQWLFYQGHYNEAEALYQVLEKSFFQSRRKDRDTYRCVQHYDKRVQVTYAKLQSLKGNGKKALAILRNEELLRQTRIIDQIELLLVRFYLEIENFEFHLARQTYLSLDEKRRQFPEPFRHTLHNIKLHVYLGRLLFLEHLGVISANRDERRLEESEKSYREALLVLNKINKSAASRPLAIEIQALVGCCSVNITWLKENRKLIKANKKVLNEYAQKIQTDFEAAYDHYQQLIKQTRQAFQIYFDLTETFIEAAYQIVCMDWVKFSVGFKTKAWNYIDSVKANLSVKENYNFRQIFLQAKLLSIDLNYSAKYDMVHLESSKLLGELKAMNLDGNNLSVRILRLYLDIIGLHAFSKGYASKDDLRKDLKANEFFETIKMNWRDFKAFCDKMPYRFSANYMLSLVQPVYKNLCECFEGMIDSSTLSAGPSVAWLHRHVSLKALTYPIQLKHFYGRENLLSRLESILETNRLAVIAASIATGKTYLALRYCENRVNSKTVPTIPVFIFHCHSHANFSHSIRQFYKTFSKDKQLDAIDDMTMVRQLKNQGLLRNKLLVFDGFNSFGEANQCIKSLIDEINQIDAGQMIITICHDDDFSDRYFGFFKGDLSDIVIDLGADQKAWEQEVLDSEYASAHNLDTVTRKNFIDGVVRYQPMGLSLLHGLFQFGQFDFRQSEKAIERLKKLEKTWRKENKNLGIVLTLIQYIFEQDFLRFDGYNHNNLIDLFYCLGLFDGEEFSRHVLEEFADDVFVDTDSKVDISKLIGRYVNFNLLQEINLQGRNIYRMHRVIKVAVLMLLQRSNNEAVLAILNRAADSLIFHFNYDRRKHMTINSSMDYVIHVEAFLNSCEQYFNDLLNSDIKSLALCEKMSSLRLRLAEYHLFHARDYDAVLKSLEEDSHFITPSQTAERNNLRAYAALHKKQYSEVERFLKSSHDFYQTQSIDKENRNAYLAYRRHFGLSQYIQARKYLEHDRRFVEALDILDQLIKEEQEQFDDEMSCDKGVLYRERAEALLQIEERLDEATDTILKSISILPEPTAYGSKSHPVYVRALLTHAKILIRQNKLKEAESVLKHAKSLLTAIYGNHLHQDFIEYYCLALRYAYERKNHDESISIIKKYLIVCDQSLLSDDYKMTIAKVYFHLGYYNDAIKQMRLLYEESIVIADDPSLMGKYYKDLLFQMDKDYLAYLFHSHQFDEIKKLHFNDSILELYHTLYLIYIELVNFDFSGDKALTTEQDKWLAEKWELVEYSKSAFSENPHLLALYYRVRARQALLFSSDYEQVFRCYSEADDQVEVLVKQSARFSVYRAILHFLKGMAFIYWKIEDFQDKTDVISRLNQAHEQFFMSFIELEALYGDHCQQHPLFAQLLVGLAMEVYVRDRVSGKLSDESLTQSYLFIVKADRISQEKVGLPLTDFLYVNFLNQIKEVIQLFHQSQPDKAHLYQADVASLEQDFTRCFYQYGDKKLFNQAEFDELFTSALMRADKFALNRIIENGWQNEKESTTGETLLYMFAEVIMPVMDDFLKDKAGEKTWKGLVFYTKFMNTLLDHQASPSVKDGVTNDVLEALASYCPTFLKVPEDRLFKQCRFKILLLAQKLNDCRKNEEAFRVISQKFSGKYDKNDKKRYAYGSYRHHRFFVEQKKALQETSQNAYDCSEFFEAILNDIRQGNEITDDRLNQLKEKILLLPSTAIERTLIALGEEGSTLDQAFLSIKERTKEMSRYYQSEQLKPC